MKRLRRAMQVMSVLERHRCSGSTMRACGRAIILLCVFGAFFLNVYRAQSLDAFDNPAIWVLQAVPAALTNIFVPAAPRYTISADIAGSYLDPSGQAPHGQEAVDAAIAKIAEQGMRLGPANYSLLGNDDKGIVDLVEISFRLFGLKISSVTWAYYGLLLITSLLFCWRYYASTAALVALAILLFAEFQALPFAVFNPQLGSPLALRCIPTLSIIACLHCVLYSWKRARSPWDAVALVCQVAILIFVLHLRSTAIWQVVLVLFMGIMSVAVLWYRRRYREAPRYPNASALLLPAAFVIVGLVGLNVYRAVAFPVEYRDGEQITTRVIWHNIYSGFALHPKLAEEESLRIDDWSLFAAAGRYLTERGELEKWKEMGGESPSFSKLKWTAYDRVSRDMVFHTCIEQPVACLETFFIYKPYYFVDTLLWFYGLKSYPAVGDVFVSSYFGDVVKTQIISATTQLQERHLTATPWGSGFIWMLLLLIIGAVLAQPQEDDVDKNETFLSLALLALASTLPSFIGYPAPHGMLDSVVAINAAFQFAVFFVLITLLEAALTRLQPSPAS